MHTNPFGVNHALGVVALGGACLLGCSTSAPSSPGPSCDGGTQARAGFCVVDEVTAEADGQAPNGQVSFSRDVQPVFTHYCGVVGCHVPGSPTGGLDLAPGFAYDQLVDAQAGETRRLPSGPLNYVTPGDLERSYLHIKIHVDVFDAFKDAAPPAAQGQLGTEMPANATGSILDPDAQIGPIDTWIMQGAPNN
ncbi:MAG TPA: hypothetical protein VE987_07650 [Polyangiaceae bacterium]|nr:hypothetical protein [Polyangiaceae bacterium]